MNKELLLKVKNHCKTVLERGRCACLAFHNWQHTKEVVFHSKHIAQEEGLDQVAIEEIVIAAYFHDIGNDKEALNHEKTSCEYARLFLTQNKYCDQGIRNVLSLINATAMPQRPETIAQKVICDADLAHLGQKNFLEKNNNLRREWEQHHNISFTDGDWTSLNVKFLNDHLFHTDFAQSHYNKQKNENLSALKQEPTS